MPAWTVLVVDDHLAYRNVLSVLLETDPRLRLLATAHDGQSAVELAEQQCPDAIILDVQMPTMDGLTALPRLRRACPDSVIAMYCSDPDSAVVALERGADMMADKTENPARLLDRLVELCGRSTRGNR